MRILLLFCIGLLLLTSCSSQPKDQEVVSLAIGSRFIPCDVDLEAMDPLLRDLSTGVTDSTRVHMAFSEFGQPIRFSNDALVESINLIVGSLSENADLNENIPLDSPPQDESIRSNFVLYSSLSDPGSPEENLGPAILLFSNAPTQGHFPQNSFAILIHGDLSLYEAFLSHWHSLHQEASSQSFRQLRTYSDAHDHRAWFFPHPEGVDSSNGIISNLEAVLAEMTKPAKVRVSMPQWDASHTQVAKDLVTIANEHEADLGILLADSNNIAPEIQRIFRALPRETFRYSKAPLLQAYWLVDGPILKSQDAFPERSQVVSIGSHNWTLSSNASTFNMVLTLFDKTLFEDLEQYWFRSWEDAAP